MKAPILHLPEGKVSKIISSRKVSFNYDNASESHDTDSKRFVLLPFINSKLANEVKWNISSLLVQYGTYIH